MNKPRSRWIKVGYVLNQPVKLMGQCYPNGRVIGWRGHHYPFQPSYFATWGDAQGVMDIRLALAGLRAVAVAIGIVVDRFSLGRDVLALVERTKQSREERGRKAPILPRPDRSLRTATMVAATNDEKDERDRIDQIADSQ